jgi:hypothetical protein
MSPQSHAVRSSFHIWPRQVASATDHAWPAATSTDQNPPNTAPGALITPCNEHGPSIRSGGDMWSSCPSAVSSVLASV